MNYTYYAWLPLATFITVCRIVVHMRVGAYIYPTYGGTDFRRVVDGIETCLKKESIDVLLAPEYANIPPEEQRQLSIAFPDTLLVAGTTHVLVGNDIYNRAHAFKAGRTIHTYDKRHLTENEHYALSMPRVRDDRMREEGFCRMKTDFSIQQVSPGNGLHSFALDGSTYAIEICMDHFEESYRKAVDAGREPLCDYQIVLSCGMAPADRSLAIKANGICVMVDGHDPFWAGHGRASAIMRSHRPRSISHRIGRSPAASDEIVVFSSDSSVAC